MRDDAPLRARLRGRCLHRGFGRWAGGTGTGALWQRWGSAVVVVALTSVWCPSSPGRPPPPPGSCWQETRADHLATRHVAQHGTACSVGHSSKGPHKDWAAKPRVQWPLPQSCSMSSQGVCWSVLAPARSQQPKSMDHPPPGHDRPPCCALQQRLALAQVVDQKVARLSLGASNPL